MIIDNEAQLVTTVAFDLGNVRPGPGKPIKLSANGVGGSLVITMGPTSAAAGACTTVDATDDVEFHLPANTQQFIKATFGSGSVSVVLDSQTAV